jgi:predicted transcriptional regulator
MNPLGKNSTKRRDRVTIIADILEIANKGNSKTRIIYKSNLSFRLIDEYLRFMLEINLLEESIQENKKVFKATDKGFNFLENFYDLANLLETEEDKRNSLKIPPLQLLKINC